MVVVHTFATFIKKIMIDKRKFQNMNGGEIGFGTEILIFIVALFVLWILAGGASKPVDQKASISEPANTTNPGLLKN